MLKVLVKIKVLLLAEYDSCRKRIVLYPWPGSARYATDFEKEAWVNGRVDLTSVAAVRALGGLLR